MNDTGFMLIMVVLIVMGLLYTFTDFRLEPLVTTDGGILSGNSTSSRKSSSISRTSKTPATQTRIEIQKVKEVRNLTGRQEEARKDQDSDYRGDEEGEYVIIAASKNNPYAVSVTGWTLKNRWDTAHVTIGQAYRTTGPDRTRLQDIVLEPGDILYVMSGEKPSGWFAAELNVCHGYIKDRYDDKVAFPIKNNCPDIDETKIPTVYRNEELCMEAIRDQRTCEASGKISSRVSYGCHEYIRELFTYNTCVEHNYTSPDFQTGQWVFYLDLDDPIWDIDNDGLILSDRSGDIVDILGDF